MIYIIELSHELVDNLSQIHVASGTKGLHSATSLAAQDDRRALVRESGRGKTHRYHHHSEASHLVDSRERLGKFG